MSNEEEKSKTDPSKDSLDALKKEEPIKDAPDKPSKKDWKLAPRTGQRHANPFARKSR